jgi:hypothetical protein
LLDITCADTNQFDLQLATGVKGDLAVNSLLESVVWIFFNSVPLNDGRVDFVNDLQENLAVTNIFEQVVNVNIFDFKGVDPETELTLFTGAFDIVVNKSSSFKLSLLFLSKLL